MAITQVKVQIYTTRYCPFCIRAKYLLDSLDVDYQEIPVDGDPKLRAHMESITSGYTVPQILINDTPIGGSDDLQALHHKGDLQDLLFPTKES